MEVVDECKDLLGRSFDVRRALNTESVGPGRGIDKKNGDQNDDYDGNFLEHLSLRCSVECGVAVS